MREIGDYRRYAVYWSPEGGSALARFGAAWFGWEPELRRPVQAMDLDLPRPMEEIRGRPARYGLHATLRSPFRLRNGRTAQALDAALAGFAARTPPATVPPLRLDRSDRFVSLRPAGPSPEADALAAGCVIEFHRFAALPEPAELARRRAVGLSPLEDSLLLRWGYPYVLEAFRFHLTLTGPLDRATAEAVMAALSRRLAPLVEQPLTLASLCLFGDPGDGPFHLLRRYALAG